jgi:aspartate carbamoyltransferase catalytic subunit
MNNLLSIDDLGASGIEEILRATDRFVEVSNRPIPKVPALRGRTVATSFFEDSTRTRLSFEAAAQRLSADVMTFTAATSSLSKGESLRDTVETLCAMGIDALVVRHARAGAVNQIARWVPSNVCVLNAGDGRHEHPTQALLDAYTIRTERVARDLPASFEGLRIVLVGDIVNSRVARSNIKAFAALGADVVLVAPQSFLPSTLEGWPVTVSHDLDAELAKADVVEMLRIQQERIDESELPSLREYTAGYGLTADRARLLRSETLLLHPGPMNRGVEISAEACDLPNSVITKQVAYGVAVRMAVLFLLLGAAPRGGGVLTND